MRLLGLNGYPQRIGVFSKVFEVSIHLERCLDGLPAKRYLPSQVAYECKRVIGIRPVKGQCFGKGSKRVRMARLRQRRPLTGLWLPGQMNRGTVKPLHRWACHASCP